MFTWRRMTPFIAFAATLALYLFTRAGQHTYDGMMFSNALSQAHFGPSTFRPHNILYLPAAIAFRNGLLLLQLPPAATGAFVAGQALSALMGSSALAILCLMLQRLVSPAVALTITLLAATTNALWSMGTEVEVYTTSLVAVAALYLSLARRRPSPSVAGILWGVTILGHLTNALLIIPLLVHCLLWRRELGLRAFVKMSLFSALVAGGVYLIIGVFFVGVRTPSEFFNWVVAYAGNQQSYGKWIYLLSGFNGFMLALIHDPSWPVILAPISLFLLCAVFSLIGRHRLLRRYALTLIVHIIVWAVFFSWWEPLNIEFWVVTMLPLMVLVGLAVRAAPNLAIRVGLLVLLCIALAGQIIGNFPHIRARMDPSGDPWNEMARIIIDETEVADVLITFNDKLQYLIPIEVGYQRIFSLDMLAHRAPGGEPDVLYALEWLDPILEEAREYGGRPLFTRAVVSPEDHQLRQLGLTREEYGRILREHFDTDFSRSEARGLLWH